jgi:cysteine-rich repeat protein
VSRCGNGVRSGTEQCDDGNTADGDGCDSNCTPTACGNGVVTGGEQCDDGNTADGDGCDSNCTPTACGNGIVTGSEECDDGNLVPGDGCQPDCTLQRCGNGVLDPGEECDDGNLVDGDGCSATCRRQEICGDLEDEDGDGLFDCEDPDCVGVQNPILRDPGRILIFPAGTTLLDRYRTRGGVPIGSPALIDPPNERVGILVTNSHNVLFKTWLEPGAFPVGLPSTPNRWYHVDRKARTEGGVFGFEIGKKGNVRERHRIRLKLFGNFSAATEPTMTLQIVIGKNLFCNKATWTSQPFGWRLPIHDD